MVHLVLLVVMLVFGHACTDRMTDGVVCAGVGCSSGFELATTIDHSLEIVQTAAVTVCRNGECRIGDIRTSRGIGKDGRPTPESTTAMPEPSSQSGPGAGRLLVEVVPTEEDSQKVYLGVTWRWDWSTTPNATRDVFDIAVEANGQSLYTAHRVLQYAIHDLSDPVCGGPICGLASTIDEGLDLSVVREASERYTERTRLFPLGGKGAPPPVDAGDAATSASTPLPDAG